MENSPRSGGVRPGRVLLGVYLAGWLLVRRVERGSAAAPLRVCSLVELVGVLTVGTLSAVDRAAFPDATVWSDYGAGYLFVPLALPVLVLLWLRHRTA